MLSCHRPCKADRKSFCDLAAEHVAHVGIELQIYFNMEEKNWDQIQWFQLQ